MSTDRDVERIVRSWLDEGVTALPDRVLDLVLDQIPATPQRRAGWLARRFPIVNSNIVRFGLAAVVVVLAVILGVNFLPGPNTGGPPDATPSPTASPLAWPDTQGTDLAAGTYLANAPLPAEARVTIGMPAGWIACGVGPDQLAACAGPSDPRAVEFLMIDNVVADPCDPSRALLDPPVGPAVEDLVTAISNLPGFEATAPVDVTLGGFAGKEFELTAPLRPACVLDDNGLGTWSLPDGGINGVGPGEVNLLRILDINGVRIMITAAYQPAATANEVTEIRGIFDSIHIEP